MKSEKKLFLMSSNTIQTPKRDIETGYIDIYSKTEIDEESNDEQCCKIYYTEENESVYLCSKKSYIVAFIITIITCLCILFIFYLFLPFILVLWYN